MMPVKNLEEIKKQIKELLDKGYIRQSSFTLGIGSTSSGEEGWIIEDGC